MKMNELREVLAVIPVECNFRAGNWGGGRQD